MESITESTVIDLKKLFIQCHGDENQCDFDEYGFCKIGFIQKAIPTPITLEESNKKVEENNVVEKYEDDASNLGSELVQEIPGKRFIAHQKFIITYKTHIDKILFIENFKKKYPTIKFIRLAHETGDKNHNYNHTHAVIDFGKIIQSSNCRVFDWNDIHPNIRALKTVTHFKNACMYLAKEDHSNDDLLLTKINKVEAIWEAPTLQEALLYSNVNEANNVMTLYNNRPKNAIIVKHVKLRFWQVNFAIELLKPLPIYEDEGSDDELVWIEPTNEKNLFPYQKDGRQITVGYDPKGKNGKTEFVKYMVRKDPKRFFAIQGLGQVRDAMEVIKNALASGWSGETLFITFPRQCADHKIYESLECFIDGFGTTQKYSGTTLEWNARRVVIFTNFMPDLQKMTIDRWDIRKINDDTKFMESIHITKGIDIYKQEHDQRLNIKKPRLNVGDLTLK